MLTEHSVSLLHFVEVPLSKQHGHEGGGTGHEGLVARHHRAQNQVGELGERNEHHLHPTQQTVN